MLQDKSILLVEDDPAQADLMLEVFSEHHFNASNSSLAQDGEQAMDMLYQRNGFEDLPLPSLVLLDLNIPKKNGKQVLEEIKSSEKLKHIPVLVLTSSRLKDDVTQCYQLHANAYMVKPNDLDDLIVMIEKMDDFWFSQVCLPSEQ